MLMTVKICVTSTTTHDASACWFDCIVNRDVTKFAFEFDNVLTSNIFSKFEICRIFSRTRRRIRTSCLHDRHHMSTLTGHRNNQLNKCAFPNSLKGPKIILDMADRHVSKDGPFRIFGNALAYLLSDFFGITFPNFFHRHVTVWLHSHSNGFVLRILHSTNAKFSWLCHIPNSKQADRRCGSRVHASRCVYDSFTCQPF